MAAWAGLIAATVYLVRAETHHPRIPEGIEVFPDLVYRRVGAREVKLDVYVPDQPAPAGGRPAILALHGGGWVGGSRGEFVASAARLVRHGYVVVAADYLLSRHGAPAWPENLEDVREAVRWTRRHARRYGIDPRRIAALGLSAGGHLAALLGTDPDDDPARVAAVIDFYGPADLPALVRASPGAATPAGMLLGGTVAQFPARYDDASPVRHVTSQAAPMLLVHGTDDRLVPPDQSRRLARALERAGVPHRLIVLEGARHSFGLQVAGRDLLPDLLAFLDDVWNHDVRVPTPVGRKSVPLSPHPQAD